VVDEAGKPLVVYHGTRAATDFSQFSVSGPIREDEEISSSGSGADPTSFLGAHFAREPSVANRFVNKSVDWMRSRYEAGQEAPRVLPVYLAVKNLKDFGSESNLRDFIYQGEMRDEYLTEQAMQADGIEPETEEAEEWNQKYTQDPQFRAEQNRWIFESYRPGDEDEPVIDAAQDLAFDARSRLEEQGYDGIRYKNEVEGGTSFVAFNPEQIKSAIGNRGTFDPAKADITMNLRRQPPAAATGVQIHGVRGDAGTVTKILEGAEKRNPIAVGSNLPAAPKPIKTLGEIRLEAARRNPRNQIVGAPITTSAIR